MRYYCDSSLKKDDDKKWYFLIDIAFSQCNTVEFNILRKGYDRVPEIVKLSKSLLSFNKEKEKRKIYASGCFLEYKLTHEVKKFILSKRYKEWLNYYLEDIALLQKGKEILSTITHENYVILYMTENQRNELNNQGFEFYSDWGAEPFND